MKAQLRAQSRAARKALTPTQRKTAEDDALRRYKALARPPPKVAAFYSPIGSEFSPERLAYELQQSGVQIVLPAALDTDSPLAFVCADVVDLQHFSPLRAAPGAKILTPDLVFTPLLAFDAFGGRLGQGRGCYDRTMLAARRKTPATIFIGLAYSVQQVQAVPVDAHDQRLDGVLTETAYLDFTCPTPMPWPR